MKRITNENECVSGMRCGKTIYSRLWMIENILGRDYDLYELQEMKKRVEYAETGWGRALESRNKWEEKCQEATYRADSAEKRANDYEALVMELLGDDCDLDRLKELVEADKAGRCVVLSEPMKPMIWKPGDTDVYCPKCENTLSGGWPLSDADDCRKLCQCPRCGQSIDDTKAESALEKMKEANP